MYGPMKHPETTPQENDIIETMIATLNVAAMKETAMNALDKIQEIEMVKNAYVVEPYQP